jgi:DNA modification methylase
MSGENRLRPEDRPVHDWYRFVLCFPPHLVRTYLDRFEVSPGQVVLDPFCGTGTTLVECQKRGVTGVGIERNPMAHFASQTKLNWAIDPDRLVADAENTGQRVESILRSEQKQAERVRYARNGSASIAELLKLPAEAQALLLKGSIEAIPLHKVLLLLETIEKGGHPEFRSHSKLALAHVIVRDASNLHFGPEVGVGTPKPDSPVISLWLKAVRGIANDLRGLGDLDTLTNSRVHLIDARNIRDVIEPRSVDAVITSPPYPNEKDYTRATRLESVILGFIRNKLDLRTLKHGLLRSNTRNVYKSDDDDLAVTKNNEIQRIARSIEKQRVTLGKTSGFERLYARVTKLYFGGMARHLASLRPLLRPGARLAYLVGDQASYLRVMIKTGDILADIARSLGYSVEASDLFRTRFASATGERLSENVLVLKWPESAQPNLRPSARHKRSFTQSSRGRLPKLDRSLL